MTALLQHSLLVSCAVARLEVAPPRRGACQALRRRGALNAAGNGRDHRGATGTAGMRSMEGGMARLKVAPPRRGADFPGHSFAFFASNPLRALRFRLALPLRIPCAVARQDAAPPEAGRKLLHGRCLASGGAASSRAGGMGRGEEFSNDWKKSFQSLEKSGRVFQPLEKYFPIIGKMRKIFPIVGKLSGGAA